MATKHATLESSRTEVVLMGTFRSEDALPDKLVAAETNESKQSESRKV
jgi:hypothetical protein